jgi:hypothetical protein
VARLAVAVVDAEVVLHSAGATSGVPVVAERRSLAENPHLERLPDRLSKRDELGVREGARRAERVQARAPERLVDVDVPEARGSALVEKCGLERSSTAGKRLGECPRRELALERLAAEPARAEVLVELAGLEERPRSEPPDVAVGDVRPVV